MSELIIIKKGDIKTGLLSKRIAAEIKFHKDKIVVSPNGWKRIFNNSNKLSLIGDKLEITRIVEAYQN